MTAMRASRLRVAESINSTWLAVLSIQVPHSDIATKMMQMICAIASAPLLSKQAVLFQQAAWRKVIHSLAVS